MKLINKIKAVLNPNTCLNCGSDTTDNRLVVDGYYYHYSYGSYETVKCGVCNHLIYHYEYGQYDSPWELLDTPLKRFNYLFLNKY